MTLQLESGDVFAGHYLVERALSKGGMGAVYVVTDVNTDRQRALKVMLPTLAANHDAQARFAREARVGASIRSEHVIEVLDAGVDEETSTPYLVMELLEGNDLAHTVAERGPLPPSEVATIFEQLCHALTAAHIANIVHRDLKPENLFMARSLRSDADITLKILDFGIAKIVAESNTGSATKSIGSPLWMAPEQTRAGSQIVPQTDIWALGLIAFFLLTGRSYWLAANEQEAGGMMVLREMAYEPLVPASERAGHLGVAHLLPPGFDTWFAHTVNREQAGRFGSADAALRALLTVLTPGGVEPQRPGTANPSSPQSSSPQPSSLQASSQAIADTVPHLEPAPSASRAEPSSAATGLPQPSSTTGATALPTGSRPPSSRGGRGALIAGVVVIVGIGAGLFLFRDQLTPEPSNTRRGRERKATTSASAKAELVKPVAGLAAIDLYTEPPGKRTASLSAAAFWLGAARSFAEATTQPGAPVRWKAAQHFCEGEVALVSGDQAAAEKAFRAAIALDAKWAAPHTGLALTLSRQGSFDAALDSALAAQQREGKWFRVFLVTASVYGRAGKLEESLQERRRALELHPNNPTLMAEVALGCHAVRLDSEATRLAHAALAKDPDLVAPRLLLAEQALEADDGKTALEQATRAAATDPRNAATHLARADALVLQGDPVEAKRTYERALSLADEAHVEDVTKGRWREVREALAAGRLPPRRGEAKTGSHRSHARPSPHRTACAPGDPLCSNL